MRDDKGLRHRHAQEIRAMLRAMSAAGLVFCAMAPEAFAQEQQLEEVVVTVGESPVDRVEIDAGETAEITRRNNQVLLHGEMP